MTHVQQQQLLQRDFIEKEMRDGELVLAEKKKQMEKEVKEKQLQLEEKKLLADKHVKEKQLVSEREIKEKQLLADERRIQLEREKIAAVAAEKERQLVVDRELKEKQLQLEREKMVAEAIEKERQTQLERNKLAAETAFKEKELQAVEKQKLIEMAERDRLKMDERAEKEKEKMKLEYEEKLELRTQLAEEKQRSAVLEVEMSYGRKESEATHVTGLEEHRSLGAQDRIPCSPTPVQGLSMETTQAELDRRISALVEPLIDLSSFAGTPHQHNTNMQATPLLTTKSLLESPTTSSLSYTPTNTSQTVLAHHSHRPTPTTLPLVHAERITDKHLQPSQYQITGSEDIQVSMKSSFCNVLLLLLVLCLPCCLVTLAVAPSPAADVRRGAGTTGQLPNPLVASVACCLGACIRSSTDATGQSALC